jgi:carboxypeptidase T
MALPNVITLNRFIFAVTLFLFIGSAQAQNTETYLRAKIKLDQTHTIEQLAQLGIETDHGAYLAGKALTTELSMSELTRVKQAGFQTYSVIPDLKKWYHSERTITERNGCDNNTNTGYQYNTPVNYQDGTYGGYFRYQEMLDILDKMRQLYPNLITVKTIITDTITTHEGRPLYWVKISDNPDINEAEPQVLYTALHHAREPNSLSQMLFYMWYLLENYSTNPEIKAMLEQAELYFIPCINPDGYLYNELTDPAGGGFWRKNRRDNQDGSLGVDLNRNYGYEWGHDNTGSNPNPVAETYRGPSPFSEPESRMVKLFCEQHDFKFALNYHTFGNLLIYPWAWSDEVATPEFSTFGKILNSENSYKAGTATETVGYQVNGSSDDFMYGGESIFSFTPEVGFGTSGFWPAASEIDQLNKSALRMNLILGQLPLKYAEAGDVTLNTTNNTLQGNAKFALTRYGLSPGGFTVSITPQSANVLQASAAQVVNLNLLEEQQLTFSYTLAPSIKSGDTIRLNILVDNGSYIRSKLVTGIYAQAALPIFTDTLTSLNQWQIPSAGNWALTTESFYSVPTSCTDSPIQEYADNTNVKIQSAQSFLIPQNAVSAVLRYQAKWQLEDGFDYVVVGVASNGGPLLPQCASSTAASVAFVPGTPVYSGYQSDWRQECVDLLPFKGQNIQFGFDLVSDDFITADGFYFDDVVIEYTLTTGTYQVGIDGFQRLTVAPNPAQQLAIISWDIQKQAVQVLQIFDAQGVKVRTINTPKSLNGSLEIDVRSLPIGNYQVHLILENGQQVIGSLQKI